MPYLDNRIQRELEHLCRLSASDFSAMAVKESPGSRFRWTFACNSRNERYKRMTLKTGVGPAGLAIRIGKPVHWDGGAPPDSGAGNDCPLMTAEQLCCAAAFPIYREQRIDAVLLVARRSPSSYSYGELTALESAVHERIPPLIG